MKNTVKTFNGYIRPNGAVGIRNHVVAIANCSCANGIVNRICAEVPDVIPLIHTYGCSIPGEFDRWRRVLTGVCTNPNIYGVLLIGVGCETDDAKVIGQMIHERSGMPVFAQIVQDAHRRRNRRCTIRTVTHCCSYVNTQCSCSCRWVSRETITLTIFDFEVENHAGYSIYS